MKEVNGVSAMRNQAPGSGEGRVVDQSEIKDRPRYVTFVNYDAEEKERKEQIQKRMKTSKKDFEVAKEEDDAEAMKRLTRRMERLEGALDEMKQLEAEREASSEEEEEDDNDDDGEDADLPMSGTEE